MKRATALLLALCMVVTLIPSVAIAKEGDVNTTTNSTTNSTYNGTNSTTTNSTYNGTDSTTNSTTNTTNSTSNSTTNSTNSTKNTTTNSTTNSTKNLSDEEKELYPEFTPLPYIIDGVIVSVSAPAGVFPKGATYKVTKVDEASKKLGDEAVDKIDDNNRIIAKSYTYDIKVYDENGNSIQPKDATKVNVSFKSAEVADTNLNTEVYHINEEIIPEDTDKTDNKDDNLDLAKLDPNYVVDESRRVKLSAEQLIVLEDKDIDKAADYSSSVLSDAIKDNRTAVVESSSFSSYVVNFTYGRKNYHMYNVPSMTVEEIGVLVGLENTDNITDVSSNSDKLTVVGSNKDATVTPQGAITADDEVKLTIKIDTTSYDINITASVYDSGTNPIVEVDRWDALQDQLDSCADGTIIKLIADITSTGDRLDVNDDDNKNVTIDLNGQTINRGLSSDKEEDGHVMQVHQGTLTINDSTGTIGKITGGYADNGGAIYITDDASVTINGGTITGNKADDDGGAIYCEGKLYMNGGIISNNTAFGSAGAIYISGASGSKMELRGVDINSNTADDEGGAMNLHIRQDSVIDNCIIGSNHSDSDYGGAIYMDADDRKLTITNSQFNENHSDDDGGAIFLEAGTIEMTGGFFYKNESKNDSGAVKVTDDTTFTATETEFRENTSVSEEGGAIKNASNTTLEKCTFTSNKAQKEGGAVWSDDKLVINGCTFENNICTNKGGAIYSDDKLTITGTNEKPTEMTGNACQKGNGGAIFVGGSSEDVEIAGKIIISDNSAKDGNNIYLRDDRVLKTTNKILDGSKIYLTAENEMGVVVKDFGVYNPKQIPDTTSGPHNFFKSDNGLGVRRNGEDGTGNDVELYSGWAKIQDDINNAAENGATVDVYTDFTATEDDEALVIPEGSSITLDLKGNTLNRNLTEKEGDSKGHVIDVTNGNLTIIDSSLNKTGTLTGGYDEDGGGIVIGSGGTCTIKSCNIVGNKATEDGGGIFNYGTLIIDASEEGDKVVISDNSSEHSGGGIYNRYDATISLKKVDIKNNSCGDDGAGGGGMYLEMKEDAIFTDISVTQNNSSNYAGGITLNAEGRKLTIQGESNSISNNTSSDGIGGIHIKAGDVVMDKTMINANVTGKDAGGVKVEPNCSFNATNCTINSNKANGGEGGGLKNHGISTLTDCELNSNYSSGAGGGVYNNKSGDNTASVNLTNCPVINNTSRGNGGGIYNNADLTVSGENENNKITGNKASLGSGIYIDSSSTNSLIKDKTKITGNAVGDESYYSDVYVNNSGDARLGLDNSFTPYNDYIYVDCSDKTKELSNVKILDNVMPFQPPTGYTLSLSNGFLKIDEGRWSKLQDLINNTTVDNTLTLTESYSAVSSDTFLEINKNITIDLNGHTLDRKCSSESENGHVFVIRNGSTLTIKDSSNNAGRITGGYSDKGGAFYVQNGATLRIEGGTISGNRADEEGGAIYLDGRLEMTGGIIDDNYSDDVGGAIYCYENGSFDISNVTFTKNSSDNSGGAINAEPDAVKNATSAIHNCTFTENSSGDNGGAIRLASKDFTLTIDGNTTIDNNYSSDDGGAIYIHNGTVEMNGGSISNNGTDNDSGAVKVTGNTEFRATNVNISGNSAAREEAGAMKIFGNAELTGCTLNNNVCAKEGGAISIVDGTTRITNCKFNGNNCTRKGGAIYSDSNLYINDVEVTGNNAKEGGGIYADDNIYIQGKIVIKDNTGRDKGNNYYCDERLQLSEALDEASEICVQLEDGTGKVTENYSTYHGGVEPSKFFTSDEGFDASIKDGEVYFGSSWSSLEDQFDDAASGTVIDIDHNYSADDDDGPLTVDDKNIIVDLHGYTLNRNRTDSGSKGHVFRLINGATLTIRDSSGNNSGIITGGYANNGGAVNIDDNSTLNIEGGTIEGNSADNGGAIFVHTGTVNMSGGVITGNNADNGAGIFLEGKDRANLVITGGEITKNEASDEVGGIYVEEGDGKTATIHVSGNPKVYDNAGKENDDIYLDKGAIINVDGALTNGAKLVVDKEGGEGQITSGYGTHNSGQSPSEYFSSAIGYSVLLVDDEATLGFNTRGEDDYAKPFVEPKNQIETNLSQLGNANWMAGISGERYLNEINMTVTHDSSMKNIETKWFDFTFWMPIGPFVHKLAKTQEEYIDEQMQHGIRKFDLRLNPVYKKFKGLPFPGYYWEDDGENIFMCHGKTKFGTIQALDHNDDYLKFNTILDWSAEFLREHPTETIILELAAELDVDYQNPEWTTETFARAGRILNDFSRLKNPSTGESYLYKEPEAESYLEPYTHMPQLKDCRGKVVIMSNSSYLDKTGGFTLGSVGVKSWSGQDHTISPEQKIVETQEHYEELETSFGKTPGTRDGRLPLRTDVGKMDNFVWSFGLNVTHEQNTTSYVWRRLKVGADCAPYEYARTVNGALFGADKLFDSTSNNESNKIGSYLGWVSIDGAKEKYAREVWRTNFNYDGKFPELDAAYVTLTIEPDQVMQNLGYKTQEYTLLKGTTIPVPDNIYKNLDGQYLKCWGEVTGQQQVPFFFYYPGDSLTVNENIILKPVFYKDGQVPVSIEWVDGNNADNLRANKISFEVQRGGDPNNTYEFSVTKEQGYRTSVKLDEGDIVVPKWSRIGNYPEFPHGVDGKEQYRYELDTDDMFGYVFRFIHTPINPEQRLTGNISWIETNDDTSKRPISIRVSLYRKDNDVCQETITVFSDQNSYTFENVPRFSEGKEIEYYIKVDPIENYATIINGYDITNVLKSQEESIEGYVVWDDNNNENKTRPESVKLQLYANGVSKGNPQTVETDDSYSNPFKFSNTPHIDSSGKTINYTVEQTTQPEGYITTVTTAEDGSIIVANKYLGDNKYAYTLETYSTDKECREAVAAPDVSPRNLTKTYVENTTVTVDAQRMRGYDFLGWYKVEQTDGDRVTKYSSEKVTPDYDYAFKLTKNTQLVAVYDHKKTEINGTIEWVDNDDEYGKRPDYVTINILRNGSRISSNTVKGWKPWKFDNLDYQDGNNNPYKYTVTQDAIPDYKTEIITQDDGSILIRNTYQKKEEPVSKYTLDVYSSNKECKASIIEPSVSPDKDEYDSGTKVNVTANNKYGYEFLGWYEAEEISGGKVTKYGKLVSTDMKYSFNIGKNTKLVAIYQPNFTEDMWPTPKSGLKADKSAKVLLNKPDKNLPEGYKLMYAIGASPNEVPSDENFRTSMPEGYSAGSYYVWVKIVGDDSHDCNISPRCITVEMTKDEEKPEEGGHYEDVPTTPGEVKDITGSDEAPNEDNPYNVDIEGIPDIPITDEQRKLGVNIWMEVLPVDSSKLTDAQKQKIKNAARDYTVCAYFDIVLFVKVGLYSPMEIHYLNSKSFFSFDCPVEYRSNNRAYAAIRLHEGTPTFLHALYDAPSGRIGIESDQFSVYALAYKDLGSGDDPSGGGDDPNGGGSSKGGTGGGNASIDALSRESATYDKTYKVKAAKTKDELYNISYVFKAFIDKLF